jgi:hypothetical protein
MRMVKMVGKCDRAVTGTIATVDWNLMLDDASMLRRGEIDVEAIVGVAKL